MVTPTTASRHNTLLVLPGIMYPLHSWPRLEAEFADARRLVFVELPGVTGASAAVPQFTWEFLLGATVNILDSLSIQHCDVLAASACGPLGYRLAHQHGDRISRLVLVGAPSHNLSQETEAVIRHMDRFIALMPSLSTDRSTRKEFAGIIADTLTLSNKTRGRRSAGMIALALRHKLSRLPREDYIRFVQYHHDLMLNPDAEAIPPGVIEGVPTLAVYGQHDGITPPESGRELAKSIADCTVAVMKECGHMLNNERSKEFNDLVKRFLAGSSLESLPYLTYLSTHQDAHASDLI
ncbi:alpha/beta fold hydrolase [Streptomyces sp. NPDC093093]|uniref:alpha/beta fold hydrolase n=1 Tax=Streptomyces sp. NPDC093093 TaxID=3366025 RepID=UPI003800FD1A